jgi:hypothetical protein
LRNAAGEDILLNVNGAVDANGEMKAEIADLNSKIAEFDDK